jgi:ATP-dependent helicase HrpA
MEAQKSASKAALEAQRIESDSKLLNSVEVAALKAEIIYLKAVSIRVTKMQENPLKDRAAQVELTQALQVFSNAGGELPLPVSAPENLVRARWLLEELRVSLFAQTLGTKEPVSLQRIKKALEL